MSDDFDLYKYVSEIQDLSDLYYVSLIVLSNLKHTDYSSVAELSILLNRKDFTNLIEYYQGKTIKVPTKEEIKVIMDSISVYYYYVLLGKTWYQTLSKLGISRKDKETSDKLWNSYKLLVTSVKSSNYNLYKELIRGHENEV